jgi:hypothetical protein
MMLRAGLWLIAPSVVLAVALASRASGGSAGIGGAAGVFQLPFFAASARRAARPGGRNSARQSNSDAR